jgi:hypothetical protein
MTHPHDPLDLFRGSGQQHSLRNDAKIRQPVTLVGLQFFLRCDQAAVSRDGTELLEDADVHGYSILARCFAGERAPGKQGSASVHKRQTLGRSVAIHPCFGALTALILPAWPHDYPLICVKWEHGHDSGAQYNLPVKQVNGAMIYIRDVANVPTLLERRIVDKKLDVAGPCERVIAEGELH